MSDEPEHPAPKQSFADFVGQSDKHSPNEPEKRIVELVGRVFRGDDPSTFTMALAPDGRGGAGRVIEGKVADVVHHEVAFEDSTGRKTMKVRLPEDAPVKLLQSASNLLASPTAPAVTKQDVKPDPIKQQDPIGPKHDPKPDPIKQQDPIAPKHDPKTDPIKQHDPIAPKHDPKTDPIKQHDPIAPKHDPKTDPIKQHDPVKHDPKDFESKAGSHQAARPVKHDPKDFDPKPDPIKQHDRSSTVRRTSIQSPIPSSSTIRSSTIRRTSIQSPIRNLTRNRTRSSKTPVRSRAI